MNLLRSLFPRQTPTDDPLLCTLLVQSSLGLLLTFPLTTFLAFQTAPKTRLQAGLQRQTLNLSALAFDRPVQSPALLFLCLYTLLGVVLQASPSPAFSLTFGLEELVQAISSHSSKTRHLPTGIYNGASLGFSLFSISSRFKFTRSSNLEPGFRPTPFKHFPH